MAYYNGNYRHGQRQMMNSCTKSSQCHRSSDCPEQTQRQCNSNCSEQTQRQNNSPRCNPHGERNVENVRCPQNKAVTFPDAGCQSKDTCLGNPRITPAQGVAQSCVMPTPSCPVAMAYVAFQAFEELFDESKAFRIGTVFPSLFKPFMAGGKCK